MYRPQVLSTLLIALSATGCASGLFPSSKSDLDDDLPDISIKENLNTSSRLRKSLSTDIATGLEAKSREIEHSLGFK